MVAVNGKHCLHELIEDQARRTPWAPALAFEDERMTYAELERRASALAARLRARGARPEMRIALLMERSASLVVALYAILKSGAAYVPVDPLYPEARRRFILEDAGAALLLTEDALRELEAQPAGDVANPPVAGASLAYVVYTSGSTGQPKGVCVEHRNIVNYVVGITERLNLQPGMRHALVSTMAADLGNTVLFGALASGGCLHVISRERAESGTLLGEYFERESIDVLKITPSHLLALQATTPAARTLPRQRLVLGGEASATQWIESLRAMAPECEIHNHYGPTEATVGVLTYRVAGAPPHTASGTLPLGTPLRNTRVYVLDEKGRRCAQGETGELFIGGAGVARGYLNRPELTAERFVADPYDAAPGARLYRSGDLARVLPDGCIEFCGRTDGQVKLGGHRVELGEIEHALRSHGGVRDAAVVARAEGNGTKRVLAYVVPQRPEQPLWSHPGVHVLPDGTPVAHLNANETDYLYREIFTLQAYLRHGITVRPGDCIVDAGANIGLFTVFVSRLARDLRIFAFEPNPAAFACLKANAEAWGSAVVCLPYGLAEEEKWAELTYFEGLSLLSGFYADAALEGSVVEAYVRNQQPAASRDARFAADIRSLIDGRLRRSAVRARLRPLAQVIAEERIERIDLLKVNVEKSELDVLRGLERGDWDRVRQIVVEVDRAENLSPVIALLERHGFDWCVEQDPSLAQTELRYAYAIRRGAGKLVGARSPGEGGASLLPGDTVLAPGSLRKHLAERLPRHMVPQAFVLMEKLPLTENGKIDRQALPAPAQLPAAGPDFVAPRTQTEKTLAIIWSELLSVPSVGAQDNFFDLGGQSLAAIRMLACARDALGVDLQLRNLFERPTLAGLAELVDALAWSGPAGQPPSLGGGREELTL